MTYSPTLYCLRYITYGKRGRKRKIKYQTIYLRVQLLVLFDYIKMLLCNIEETKRRKKCHPFCWGGLEESVKKGTTLIDETIDLFVVLLLLLCVSLCLIPSTDSLAPFPRST